MSLLTIYREQRKEVVGTQGYVLHTMTGTLLFLGKILRQEERVFLLNVSQVVVERRFCQR